MAKKEFQAESKKLMDMMINSIYTNKEIFLRELISNASDAIDKLYYKSLTDTSVGMNKSDFRILITRDKENRILTVEDNGIGMTKAELEENLGTIAHSGSLDFKQDNKDENIDIIGQFGVGFYSSFMVADKVTVISKAYGADVISERHRHRYEFNNDYRALLEEKGLVISGTSPDDRIVETVEVPTNTFHFGAQFHPEFTSRPNRPNPIFNAFVAAAKGYSVANKHKSK